MTSLWQDVRFGARMLLKHFGVNAVAVITLALAIGVSAAIFSVVNAVILRPLPYRDPDRLVSLWARVPEHGRWRTTPANFFDWKKQNQVFEEMAAFGSWTMSLTGDGEPEQLMGTQVSEGYFSVVGVEPMLGRSFLSEEYQPGRGRVVILGQRLWQRRYGSDQKVINKSITLNGASYTVVGVMPPGIYPARPTTTGHISFDENEEQFWVPMSFSPQWAAVRTAHVLGAIARMKPGVSVGQAQSEMNTIAARLEQSYPVNKGEGIIVSPFLNEVAGELKPALGMLLAAGLMVVLIACANIAGLLMAQISSRRKEILIRGALGAGRIRLMRQFFVEGLLLSLLGGAAGLGVAKLSLDTITKIGWVRLPRLEQAALDLRVLGFTLLISLVTCLIFGLAPLGQIARAEWQSALEHTRGSSRPGFGRQPWRQLLVVFQFSTAVMLVVSAGLLIVSFWRLQRVDPGFHPDHLVSLSLTLPQSKYSDNARINNFYNGVVAQISQIPGVEAASIGYDHPLQTNWVDSFSIEGQADKQEAGSANFNAVGWDYFRTVGTQVVKGRNFTTQDDEDHPGVTIVNEAFARRYFRGAEALGRKLRLSAPARFWRNERLTSFEIVGVSGNVKSAGLTAETEPTYYVPATQAPILDMQILVRTQVDPVALVPALRKAVWTIDQNQPIAEVKTLSQVVSDSVQRPRLNMILMSGFGMLAPALAALGIYGLLSYAVAQRTQEMGIRLALGAQVRDVLKLILKQGLTLALAGEVIGLVAAFACARWLRSLLFGVGPTDLTVYLAVFLFLIVIAFFACYLPARRATKVDPLVALRYE